MEVLFVTRSMQRKACQPAGSDGRPSGIVPVRHNSSGIFRTSSDMPHAVLCCFNDMHCMAHLKRRVANSCVRRKASAWQSWRTFANRWCSEWGWRRGVWSRYSRVSWVGVLLEATWSVLHRGFSYTCSRLGRVSAEAVIFRPRQSGQW